MLQYRYKTLVQAYDMSCLQNINLPQLQLNLSLFCILLSQTKPCLCTIHINVLILTGVIGIGLTVCTVFCVPVVLVLGYMGRPIFCTLSGYRLGWKTNLPLSRPSYSPFRALFRNSEEIMSVPISTSFTVCVTSPQRAQLMACLVILDYWRTVLSRSNRNTVCRQVYTITSNNSNLR